MICLSRSMKGTHMSEISWVKITVDMFDNRKIKQIRGLPEGNNIVLVWIMLLTIAGRCNAGGMIFLTENIAYTAESLARELDFEVPFIKMAIETLAHFGMIRVDSTEFSIVNWEEYQNVDGMEKIKEQTRIRVQNYRDRQKQLVSNVTSNVTVTQGNATEEDKDIDLDKESDKETKTKNKETKKESKSKGIFQEFAGDDTELMEALKEFNQMRTLIKHPMTDGAKKRLITKLQTFPRKDWLLILHQSIDHSWQDIYPLKGDDYNGTGRNKPVFGNGAKNSEDRFNIRYSNE